MKIEHGKIIVGVDEIIESLTKEEKRALIDRLSCDEEILQDVTAQILDGWTEAISCGASSSYGDEPSPYSLDKARREIAKRAGEVQRQEIERLEWKAKSAQELEKKYRDWGFRLYRSLPRGYELPEMCP